MKESYGEGLAIHAGPESCADAGNRLREALTGVRIGRVLSRESRIVRGADAVGESGRQHPAHRYREMCGNPARSEPLCMYGNTSCGNREIPFSTQARWRLGPRRESQGSTTAMNESGKSDSPILPEKPSNKGRGALQPAERVEGRGLTKGNPGYPNMPIGHSAAHGMPSAEVRIRHAFT